MWRKAGWVFVAIYTVVILYLNILAIVNYNGFNWNALISIIVTLLPAGVIAIELSGRKASLLLILPALFVTAVFFLGNIAFNGMAIETVAKAVLFGITIILLVFFAYKHIFKK